MPKRSLRLRTAQAHKVNITKQNKFTWRLKEIQDMFLDRDANIKLWPYLVFSSLSTDFRNWNGGPG